MTKDGVSLYEKRRSKTLTFGLPLLALVVIALPLYLFFATLLMQNSIATNNGGLAEFSSHFLSVDYTFDDDNRAVTPLMMAADACSDNAAEVFLVHKAHVNKATRDTGDTALILAAEKGCTTVVRLLVAHQADVNQANKAEKTPLIVAAQSNQPQIVRLLLENGADTHWKDSNGLDARSAAKHWKSDKVLMLLGNELMDVAPLAKPSLADGRGH